MKQTKMVNKRPIEYYSWKLSNEKIEEINNKLKTVDWDGNLNSENCNINFEQFCNILHDTMDRVVPLIK